MLHSRARWPCNPHLRQAPGGGLRGLRAGRELALFHPEGRPQSCPCAVTQRSCNLRLTVTLLWRFGPQEDHERLNQLALPGIMQLCVCCTLQFTLRQGRGRRALKLRQSGLEDSNLGADLISGLWVRSTRCWGILCTARYF